MNKDLSKVRLKRVNWASDDLLCQVKLFLSEDCPSQIGSNGEDDLQIKASLHSNGMNIDDLPPGFGGKGPSYTPNQICISQIRWNRPPKFILNSEWHVVAGEESEERGAQNHREMRVLEALYPRISAIPPSPSVSPELEACGYNDSQTPIIPLNSIEDEDTMPNESAPCSDSANGVEPNVPIESKAPVNDKLPVLLGGLNADIIAAATAAYTASLKGNEMGSMVDTDLLIKILNEPKMVEALTKVSGSSMTPMFEPPKHDFSVSQNIHNIYQSKPSAVSDTLFTSQPFHSPTTSQPTLKPGNITSERANENLKPFSTFSIPYSASESPNQSNSQSFLSHGQQNGYMDRPIAGKPSGNGLELPRKITPSSNPAFFGSNASSSSEMFTRPWNSDMQSSQTSLDTSKNFSPSPRPNVVPTHNPAMAPHMSMGSSSQPAKFPLPSIRSPAVKDVNYFKSLIRLHGSGGAEETTPEPFTPQFQVSLPEVMPVSGHGHPRSKTPKGPCKFFNSAKGCKNGSSCPFEHVSLLDMRPGNYTDNTDRSKRLKISNDSLDKC